MNTNEIPWLVNTKLANTYISVFISFHLAGENDMTSNGHGNKRQI